MRQDPKYVLVNKCPDGSTMVRIIDDPTEAFINAQYDEKNGDKLYQLGQEVKIKITVEPTKVSRETWPTRHVASDNHPLSVALKDDLGIGDYRG